MCSPVSHKGFTLQIIHTGDVPELRFPCSMPCAGCSTPPQGGTLKQEINMLRSLFGLVWFFLSSVVSFVMTNPELNGEQYG